MPLTPRIGKRHNSLPSRIKIFNKNNLIPLNQSRPFGLINKSEYSLGSPSCTRLVAGQTESMPLTQRIGKRQNSLPSRIKIFNKNNLIPLNQSRPFGLINKRECPLGSPSCTRLVAGQTESMRLTPRIGKRHNSLPSRIYSSVSQHAGARSFSPFPRHEPSATRRSQAPPPYPAPKIRALPGTCRLG